MDINEYNIINGNTYTPELNLKNTYKWNGGKFDEYRNIVNMMNKLFKVNKLSEEYSYVLSFDSELRLKGVFELSHGDYKGCTVGTRELGMFLLLSGAEQFVLIHNHPGCGYKKPEMSTDDMGVTYQVLNLANMFNIKFINHIIIGSTGYHLINDELKIEQRLN